MRLRHWIETQPTDGAARNLLMMCTVAIVSALLVSSTAIWLQPKHAAHLSAMRAASMSSLIESIPSLASLVMSSSADVLETHLIDLDTGCFVEDGDVDAFDAQQAATDPEQSRALTSEDGDTATLLKRRTHLERVHLLYDNAALQLAILPVQGPGYQSTLYAWLVLDSDLDTIVALNVHEHGETPGIGSRVEDPLWQQQWTDKKLLDDQGNLAIRVTQSAASSPNELDGITGATRTSMGVGNMVQFWTGPLGFGPFLDRQRQGDPC
jgi:Na+-transporting NADH:ubiquinone oxidoreductase subunit C